MPQHRMQQRPVAACAAGADAPGAQPDLPLQELQGPMVELAHKLADAAAAITRRYFRCVCRDRALW